MTRVPQIATAITVYPRGSAAPLGSNASGFKSSMRVAQVVPLKAFYDGEDYHQDYADKNPNNPYIQVCDVPKMAALKEQFPELFQAYKGH